MSLRILILASICLLSNDVSANDYYRNHADFLKSAAGSRFPLTAKTSFQPSVGVKNSDRETDLTRFDLRLGSSLGVSNDIALTGGISFGMRHYAFDDTDRATSVDLDEDLFEIVPEVGITGFVTDDLMLTLVFRPGLFSDFDESLDADDFLFQGSAIAVYRWHDGLFFLLGLAVGEDFEQTRIIPVAGLSWIVSKQVRLDLLAPREIRLTWSEPFGIQGIRIIPGVYLEGHQYRWHSAAEEGNVQIQDVRAEIALAYDIAKRSSIELSGGSNFRGKFEIEGEGGLKVKANQKASAFIALTLGTRF